MLACLYGPGTEGSSCAHCLPLDELLSIVHFGIGAQHEELAWARMRGFEEWAFRLMEPHLPPSRRKCRQTRNRQVQSRKLDRVRSTCLTLDGGRGAGAGPSLRLGAAASWPIGARSVPTWLHCLPCRSPVGGLLAPADLTQAPAV